MRSFWSLLKIFAQVYSITGSEGIRYLKKSLEKKMVQEKIFNDWLDLGERIKSRKDIIGLNEFLNIVENSDLPSLIEKLKYLSQTSILHNSLIDIQNSNWNSYSQEGEDLILSRLLGERGFYVDVGAHHPFRFSNTQRFYKLGWRGINIEPDDKGFELLEKFRPEDVNLKLGVSSLAGQKTFYRFKEAAYNTFDKNRADDLKSRGFESLSPQVSNFETLSGIFSQHVDENRIDFLSVDCEGLDLEVLQSNDWSRWRPNFIIVEIIRKDYIGEEKMNLDNPISQYLFQQGYQVHSILLSSWIFSRIQKN